MAVKYRRPLGPRSPERGSHKSLSTLPFPFPSSPEHALQTLLKSPIRFVLATSLTFEDEANMAPILRPRKRLNESLAQQANRMNVRESTLPIVITILTIKLRSRTFCRAGESNKTGLFDLGAFATGQGLIATSAAYYKLCCMSRNSLTGLILGTRRVQLNQKTVKVALRVR